MIIDEKFILAPPPPYISGGGSIVLGSNNPFRRRRSEISLSALPSHLLLQIVYSTFPSPVKNLDGELLALQRESLYFLETSLRFVNRALYIACMHILRSTYLPAYDRLVRPPNSSDPFPSAHCTEEMSSVVLPHHRELRVLDRFIALLSHEERLLDASELHLPREEAYRDIFDIMQPRSRIEDLVAVEGQECGVIFFDSRRGKQALRETRVNVDASPEPSLLSNDSLVSLKQSSSTEKLSPPPSFTSLVEPDTTSAKHRTISRKASRFFSLRRTKKYPVIFPAPQTCLQPQQAAVAVDPLPFSTLSVAFSPRKVGLIYTPPTVPGGTASTTTSSGQSSPSSSVYGGSTYGSLSMSMSAYSAQRRKTLVEISRTKDESLESCARRLVHALSVSMAVYQ